LTEFNGRTGDIVVARFSEDHNVYRARVVRTNASRVTVEYIDYGNYEELPRSEVRVSENVGKASKDFVPAAVAVHLGLIKGPPENDQTGHEEATAAIRKYVANGDVQIATIYSTTSQERRSQTIVSVKESKDTLQEHLLEEGLAKVDESALKGAETSSNMELIALVKTLREAQSRAVAGKKHMWKDGNGVGHGNE